MEATAKIQSKPVIKTPDQRLRVFVSSTLQELAEERVAVRKAIQRLRLTPVMFELGARPHAPKDLYRAYLEQSHVFIGIYYQSYGWVAPGEALSGLEDEFVLSENMPRLIYFKRPAPEMQEGLKKMMAQISQNSYRSFTTAAELEELVTNDLALLLSERFELPEQKEESDLKVVFHLPIAPNKLIGREREIKMVTDWLRSGEKRLVTLLGSGGVGKSRISIAIAEQLRKDFPDGVCFITFDKINDVKLMPSLIADKLGISGSRDALESVKYFLGERKLLLILDNLEHLTPGAGLFISDLLQSTAGIKVIATSRIPLEITAEQQLQLDPFAIPSEKSKLEAALQSDAVKLFEDRVKSIKPGFAIDKNNLEDVLAICRKLDGLPLAIELAAARMRLFTPKQLAQKLSDSLEVLKGGPRDLPDRQRTMRNVVAWSYDLLNTKQKEVFHVLSIFVGGVSYDAAEQVCGDDMGDLMDVLLSLVGQNLVRLKEEASSEIRFALFDTIREYGLEKLKESGRYQELQVSHALYYLGWIKTVYRQLEKDPVHSSQLVQEETGNIRIAFNALVQYHQNEKIPKGAAASLAINMVSFWDQFGLQLEGMNWLTKALDPALGTPAAKRVKATYRMAMLSAMEGKFDEGERLAREALEAAKHLNEALLLANAQRALGKVLIEQGKNEEALVLLEASLKAYRALGEKSYAARALESLGSLYVRQGNLVAAKAVYLEGLQLTREEGNILSIPYTSLGTVLEKEGNYEEAKKYYLAGIEQEKKVNDIRGLSRTMHNLANIYFHYGDFAEAQRLYKESLAAKEKLGDVPGMATSLGNLGWIAFMEGSFDEAKNFHERSIALKRKMHYVRGLAVSLQGVALVMLYQGDYKAAYYELHEAMGHAKQSGDKIIVAGTLEVWSLLAEKQKKYERSATLFGAAAAIRKECNAPPFTNDKKRNDELEARLRKNLGDNGFEQAWNTGKVLKYEAAVELAMQTDYK